MADKSKIHYGGALKSATVMKNLPHDTLNPYKNEIWDIKDRGGRLLYHKPKTVENCLLKYGLAKWNRGSWNSKNKIDVNFQIPTVAAHVAGRIYPTDITDLYEMTKAGKLSFGNHSHTWSEPSRSAIPQHVVDIIKRVIEGNRGSWATYNYLLSGPSWHDGSWVKLYRANRINLGNINVYVDGAKSVPLKSIFSGAQFDTFKFTFKDWEFGGMDLAESMFRGSKVNRWEIVRHKADGQLEPMADLSTQLDRRGSYKDNSTGSEVDRYFGWAPKYLTNCFYDYEGESPWFIVWDQCKSLQWSFKNAQFTNGHFHGYDKQDFAEIPANTIRFHNGNYGDGTRGTVKWGAGISDGGYGLAAVFLDSNVTKVGVIFDMYYMSSVRVEDRAFGDNLRQIRIKNLNGGDWDFTNQPKFGNLNNLDKDSIVYLIRNVRDLTEYELGREHKTFLISNTHKLTMPTAWHTTLKQTMSDLEISELKDHANLKGWVLEFK